MTKPFKTVTIEYYEEFDSNDRLPAEGAKWQNQGRRRIRIITTETKFVGSQHDPVVSRKYEYLQMVHCEECGKTGVPLMVVTFSLKNKEKPGTLYTESLYLCMNCLNESEQHDEKSRTVH